MGAPQLAKAEIRQTNAEATEEIHRDKWMTVQFNPESLKVSYANQVQTPATGDQNGGATRQLVGAGTTKLALQLWFDVGSPQPAGQAAEDDVRKLTQKVAYFITTTAEGQPAVRFIWGSFQFDGVMESMEESLDFFSAEGKPLRASVSIALTQQKITAFTFRPTQGGGSPSAGGPRTPGTTPLAQAPAGSSLQGMAAAAGKGGDWQSIASANGIENPRLLTPGALIDLNVKVGANVGLGASVGASGSVGASVELKGGF